ncbi:MAG: deoxyribose-phosphate aldolase [Defluviitaleaceae bacterium]|nr:deoxyribose-phosphate aldolase [Defluviitaleaceae bacterium]
MDKKMGQYFDYALLKAAATYEEFEKFCAEGIKYNVKMLAINPSAVAYCVRQVAGKIGVGAAVGFPLGQNTIETKLYETERALSEGANEIDYVINLTELKSKNYTHIEKEMSAITNACRKVGAVSKVIFENCYLTDDEKIKLCEIANIVKPDFVKTSTGFGTGGATVRDIQLMRKHTTLEIKASGGIQTWADADALIKAGATRIGTSNISAILGAG